MKTTIAIILMVAFLILFSITSVSTDRELMETFITKHSYAPQALEATQQLYDYFEADATMPEEFRDNEAKHMRDVKSLLQHTKLAFLLTFLILAAIMPFANAHKAFIYGGAITLALTLTIATVPFNALFTSMHHVLFPQGNWIFPASSILMYYYPTRFFAAYGAALTSVMIINSLLSMIVGFVLKKG